MTTTTMTLTTRRFQVTKRLAFFAPCSRCAGSGLFGPASVKGGVCFKCAGDRIAECSKTTTARLIRSIERMALAGRKEG